MAHQFDTGQAAPQRTRLEKGVVQLLSGLKKANGGYLVEVAPYAFTMEIAADEDAVAQFVMALVRAPSIAVHVGERESRPTGISGFGDMGDLDLHVYFSSNNMRNQQIGRMEIDTAGLASDTADPGIHVALEHARELIIGRYATTPVGSDLKQAKPYRERAIITAQAITIWEQLYKVGFSTRIDEFRTVSQLLDSIRFRASSSPTEPHLPAAKVSQTTIDVNDDNLAPT